MKLYNKFLCTTGVVFLLGGTSLFAEDRSAQEILHEANQYVGSMDKYAFDAVVFHDGVENGEIIKQKYKHEVSVKVDRPGKLRIDVKGNSRNRTNYLNNGTYTMMDHTTDYYGQLKTPDTIEGTLDAIFNKYGIKAPLAQLIYKDMDKRFKFAKSKNFGTVMVSGKECHYIAFSDKNAEVHLWITTGDTPLVKSYSIFDKTVEDRPTNSASITWQTDPKITDNDFIFAAPKTATNISVISANK
jgi:hypothetical protein